MTLVDLCGRPLLNLRIAITKMCNLHCSYCHGEGEEKQATRPVGEMTADDIAQLVRIAAGLGISRVKLTGGEPLMRTDVADIVRNIAAVPRLEDLSMTTNGTLLEHLADELYESGLRRVNISIPALNEEVFHKLTGGNVNDAVKGVRAAVEAGLYPVKLNMLVMKGVNDVGIGEMVGFAAETGTILQLIELEPINMADSFYRENHKSLDDYETMLKQKAVKVETRKHMQNRRVYQLPDVKVEVVRPIENTEFCLHCSRLRVTSDGKLKPCLMRNDNLVDILTPLRKGASDQKLAELFKLANQKRQPYNKN